MTVKGMKTRQRIALTLIPRTISFWDCPVARVQVLGLYQAMTVTLTAEQEKFITEQVDSGHFKSAADVIAQGLGMLRAQEEFIRANTVELRGANRERPEADPPG